MIASHAPRRSGITLTEILISILIMGVGLISLATLFPLGLIRLRDAQRQSRSGLLSNTATADVDAQSLLDKTTFAQTWYGPFDPFLQDTEDSGAALNVRGTIAPGLPFCYDPYWREFAVSPSGGQGVYPNTRVWLTGTPPAAPVTQEARFGCGRPRTTAGALVKFLPDRPAGNASYGLPRLTNFVPPALLPTNTTYRFVASQVGATFASQDDYIFYNPNDTRILSLPDGTPQLTSPLVPQMDSNLPASYGPIQDYRYTWFVTGRQLDAGNAKAFSGEVVICENRPLALESIESPVNTNSGLVAAGETVVEGIFGYSSRVNAPSNGVGYSSGGDRNVMLRWPTKLVDPEIKVGSWIADVTYERNATAVAAQVAEMQSSPDGTTYPCQRCYWYQIVQKGDIETDANGFRRVVLTVNSPVRAKTLLDAAGNPRWTNAALIMPSVVNVFPRTFMVQ